MEIMEITTWAIAGVCHTLITLLCKHDNRSEIESNNALCLLF